MFKFAATLAMTAMAVSLTASTAEAGARGLMTGLFIGALGAHLAHESYRAERRREAYEEMQIRKRRALAAQRAAAAQQARAAQLAAQAAAAQNAEASSHTSQNNSGTTTAPKADVKSTGGTTTIAKTTTSLSESVSSSDASGDVNDNAPNCRKYSAATASMVNTVCP